MIGRIPSTAKSAVQKGFTLLEMMFVLAIAALIAVGTVQEAQQKADFAGANQLGRDLAQYNNAVRSYVANWAGQITAGGVPAELTGNRIGVDWLKSAGCDPLFTADQDYLPCSFLQPTGGLTRFGRMQFETYFDARWDAAAQAPVVDAYTVMVDPATGDGLRIRGDFAPALSGAAALVVDGVAQLANSPVWVATDGEALYCVTAGSRAGVCNAGVLPTPVYGAGKIVMVARNNALNDVWLRTDGANEMNADLSFDATLPFANRDLVNVARIFSTTAEGVQIGAAGNYAGGPPAADLVVVDGDLELWGNLFITGSMTITDGDFTVNNGAIIATQGGRPNSGDFRGHRFVDLDDTTFFINPAGTSRVQNMQIATMVNNNAAGDVTLSTRANANGAGNAAGGNIVLESAQDVDVSAGGGVSLESDNGAGVRGALEIDAAGMRGQHTNNIQFLSDSGSTSILGDGGLTGFVADAGGVGRIVAPTSLNIDTEFTNVNVLVDGVSRPLTSLLSNWLHVGTYRGSIRRATGVYVPMGVPIPACLPGWLPRITVLPIEITQETIEGASTSSNAMLAQYRPGFAGWNISAIALSPTEWTVYIIGPGDNMFDGSPLAVSANVLAMTYCYRGIN